VLLPWFYFSYKEAFMNSGRSGSTRLGDRILKWGLLSSALIIILVFILYLIMLTNDSSESFRQSGFKFLTTLDWNPVSNVFGVLPFIYGTMVSSTIAIVIAGIVGVSSAIFLTQFAPKWFADPLLFLIELLAAIPSVVCGLWGIFILGPMLRTVVQPWLQKYFGFLPLFKGPMYGMLNGELKSGQTTDCFLLDSAA